MHKLKHQKNRVWIISQLEQKSGAATGNILLTDIEQFGTKALKGTREILKYPPATY